MSTAIPIAQPPAAAEIRALIAALSSADARLDVLLGGAVDTVADGEGRLFLLRRAQDDLHRSEAAHQAAILDGMPAHVAVLDSQGRIVSVNAGWKKFGLDNGLRTERAAVGSSYLAACDRGTGADAALAAQAAEGIRSVLSGKAGSFELEYPCHSPSQERWFAMRASALGEGCVAGAVVMHHDITARIRDARELARLSQETARRERMLNTALSSITDFSYLFDARGRLLFANQRALDLWGISLEQAIGRDTYDLGYPTDSAQRIQAQVQSVIATGTTVRDEIAYCSPSGTVGFYAYVFSAALAADGSVDFVVGCTRDITEKKRSELALQESFAEFRTLAAAMPQIVWVTTPEREAIYLNQQWMEFTGLSHAQGLDGGWLGAIHPDERARATQAFEQAEGRYSYEARMRRADGVYHWWLVRAVALKDDAGTVLKWIGTCTDVDDLKRAEIEVSRTNRELQRQRTELRILLDLVPAMIWFKDTAGKIIRINERAARSVGWTVAELEGVTLDEIYPQARAARYRESDREIMRTGQPILGVVEQDTDAQGREIWTLKDKVPFPDESGGVAGIVVMTLDITERKRDQDALRELNIELENRVRQRTADLILARDDADRANRAKSDFLATMSHEIRTPISGMLGLLELLSLSLDQEQRSTLAVARESGNALMRIIDDILDFSKIEADSLELHLVAASVPAVMNQIAQLHAQVAASKGLELRMDVSPDISPVLSFDPHRLTQILNNFVNNALKFTLRGHVDISVRLLGRRGDMEELLFVVRDTGIGMTAAQVGRLFQPFVQAASETSSQFGGTGLGLVISRRLAALMGGAVKVDSEPGVGTGISLTLAFEVVDDTSAAGPNAPDEDALRTLIAARRQAPSVSAAQAEGTLLLIADDHPTNRMVLLRQAASLGYAAEVVGDGVQALTAWKAGRFAAIVTDCNMPMMSGYDLATAIRAAERDGGGGRIPIIACTANALPDAVARCISVGMDDCLVKPVSLAGLGAILDRWVPLDSGIGPQRTAVRGRVEPPTVTVAGNGLLDLALLREISAGDPIAQADMLLHFRRANEADSTALRKAVATADFGQVGQSSHRIKGSSQMLGATVLAQACARIEHAGEARDARELAAAMEAFEIELLRLNSYVDLFPSLKQGQA